MAVRAIYPYDAQGDDELSLKEGELIDLTSGPTGGMRYGDGWWEGVCVFFVCSFLKFIGVCDDGQGLLRMVGGGYSLVIMWVVFFFMWC